MPNILKGRWLCERVHYLYESVAQPLPRSPKAADPLPRFPKLPERLPACRIAADRLLRSPELLKRLPRFPKVADLGDLYAERGQT